MLAGGGGGREQQGTPDMMDAEASILQKLAELRYTGGWLAGAIIISSSLPQQSAGGWRGRRRRDWHCL